MDRVTHLLTQLSGTAAVAGDGLPLILHHGTTATFDRFRDTRDIGFHFGTLAQAVARERVFRKNVRVGGDPPWRIVSVALAVRNPVVLDQDPKDWDAVELAETLADVVGAEVVSAVKSASALHQEEADLAFAAVKASAMGSGLKAWRRIQFDKWASGNCRTLALLRSALEEVGHDGIAYWNGHERRGEPSWVAFRPESVVILGERLDGGRVEATAAQLADAGYVPGRNPMRPYPKAARQPNRSKPTGADLDRFDRAMAAHADEVGWRNEIRCRNEFTRWDIPLGTGSMKIQLASWHAFVSFIGCATGPDPRLMESAGLTGNGAGWYGTEWKLGEMPEMVVSRLVLAARAASGPAREAIPAP